MSLRFSVRHGDNEPPADVAGGDTGLLPFEVGFDTVSDKLWINKSGAIQYVRAHDAETLDGVDITQIARTDVNETFDLNLTVLGTLTATSSSALYADIAEYYETDETYQPGDILMFGSDTESTLADGTRPIMGVCSTDPAYLMNNNIGTEHFAPVALKGRVPVAITNDAKRGDYIIVDIDNVGKGKAVSSLEGIDKETLFVGVCVTASNNGTCEVKV